MKKFPIIIFHGWNLDKHHFSPLISELSRNKYKVLCPDLPGFGSQSKPNQALFLSDYVGFVLAFMDKNKIKKADFICHSFGGRIGIKLANFYPEKINKLVLTGVPGLVPVSRPKILFFFFLAKLGKLFFSLPFFSPYRNFAQKLIYRAAGASDFYNTDLSMRETFQNVVRENLRNYLGHIKNPTLLLWGKLDTVVPVRIASKMSRLIPNCQLVIVNNIGHGFPYTKPKIYTRYLRIFLNPDV